MENNKELMVSVTQLRKLFTYLMDEKREASFRYLIYEVMGFKPENYSDLYYTGLMSFKDMFYEYRQDAKKNKNV